MSQATYSVPNGTGVEVRTANNLVHAAIKSNNSGTSAPSAPEQGMRYSKLVGDNDQEEYQYDDATWLLTGLIDPAEHKYYPANDRAVRGLTLSNNGADATNDIDIATGFTAADGDGFPLILRNGLTKRLDAAWAVGTGQGGLDTGSIANTTYHAWLIRRPDTGVVDMLFSASASSPTMPANYTQKRCIGRILRESAAIVAFIQDGDRFYRQAPTLDVNTSNPGTSAVTATLKVPVGISVRALISIMLVDLSPATTTYARVSSLAQTDSAAASSNFNFGFSTGTGATAACSTHEVETNTSGQIRYRLENSTTDHSILVTTQGWIDQRGQDAAQ